MTQTETPEGLSDPIFFGSLKDLRLPAHAVVIADQDLPTSLLEHFPEALRIQAGEGIKSLGAIENLAQRVLDLHSSRPMTIVAVGGGSIGDAVGFLASILWRGVELWHVPTTLLAMVDSAHGGKTAVNLGNAKNQLGTFYKASQVVIAEECLELLPLEHREAGLAELLKALWLGAPEALELWEDVSGNDLSALPFSQIREPLLELLSKAIDVKLDIVERDPKETREIRTFLNLGHTVAHALELSMGLSHGHAVAWGMASAAVVSQRSANLSEEDALRLFKHLYPLLTPIRADHLPIEEEFTRLLERDKKKRSGELRSVVLDGPGMPRVMTIPPKAWHDALLTAIDLWENTPIMLRQREAIPVDIELGASKSELNRLLVMAHLEPSLSVSGSSAADDVIYLRRALKQLSSGGDQTIQAGNGGTTLRFLLAVAANRPELTRINAGEGLLNRPHTHLVDALTRGGAEIEQDDSGFTVRGWKRFPKRMSVETQVSSQPASAIALLAILGTPFSLSLEGELASPGYFEMTLEILKNAGASLYRERNTVHFEGCSPSQTLMNASTDASSAAVWVVLNKLGARATFESGSALQPDSKILTPMTSMISDGEFSAKEQPDLVPILTAYALVEGHTFQVVDAANLKKKESDRIEDVARLLEAGGGRVETTEDSLRVTPESRPDSVRVQTASDHRLGFAAAILAARRKSVEVDRPWVVRKSYPEFWHDLRRSGWIVTPRMAEKRL